tara:strand:+ start:183 stop:2162 length:1980 start_codon:yes stop_codon:yes gene_type:complete
MAITAETLNVILAAKDKQFAKQMKDNARRVERFSQRSQKSLNKTSMSFKKLAGSMKGLAAGLSIGILVSKSKQAIGVLDEIGKTADNLGLTTTALQELRTIAESSGMTFEEFTKGFAKFSVAVGEAATGTGEAVQAFKMLGISLTTSSGATRQTEELFNELSDAMGNFENAADKASIMADLFGQKVGIKMLNMLANGADGMAKMRKEAKAMGIVIEEHLIRDAEKAQTQLDLLSRVLSAKLNKSLVELAPALLSTTAGLANLASGAAKVVELIKSIKSLTAAPLNLTNAEDMKHINLLQEAMKKFGNEDKFVRNVVPSQVTQYLDYITSLPMDRNLTDDEAAKKYQMELALIARLEETRNRKNVFFAKVEAKTKLNATKKELELLSQTAKERDLALIQEQKMAIITKIKNEHLRAGIDHMSNPWEEIWDGEKIANEYEKAALAIHKVKFATFDLAEANKQSAAMYELAMKKYEENINSLGLSLDEFGAISETIETSMTDAFMSMVDGTATVQDAFRSMARDILAQLYKVLVVQRLVGSVAGGTGIAGAIGSAFGVVPLPTKAHGGTVGAGSPQIVGESGRELFVPQQAGRIMTTAQTQAMTSGGGGGGVVVNQTINVSTGVSQTVRTEIKSLMPQIAEGAKSAVLDAKRRGGSFGSAFA